MKRVITVLSILGCLFFMFMGGIFLLIGIGFNSLEKSFIENGVPVMAEITDIVVERDIDGDTTTSTYVSFEYEGKTYSMVSLGYSSSSLYEGKEIQIYFKPSNKSVMYVEGNKILVTVFSVIGGVLCAIGIAVVILGIFINRITRPVKEYGVKYIGKIERLDLVSTGYMNGFQTYTYTAFCSYTDKSGITQYVTSGPVTINPSYPLPPGSPVDIYVAPKKSTKYFVDINAAYAQQNMNYNNYNYTNYNNYNNNYN